MALRRKLYEKLLGWRRDSRRKALLLTGARQVGKSYLIRELGRREFDTCLELNLYENDKARNALAGARNLDDFMRRLTLFSEQPLIPGRTLVFIDEIQELPDVMTMVKFLVEDGRYDYAFSGSMLGTEFKGARSFPVGVCDRADYAPARLRGVQLVGRSTAGDLGRGPKRMRRPRPARWADSREADGGLAPLPRDGRNARGRAAAHGHGRGPGGDPFHAGGAERPIPPRHRQVRR